MSQREHRSADHRVSRVTKKCAALVATLMMAVLAVGCARIETEKGLEPTWRDVSPDTFQIGATTQSEVMEALGPPSQIIAGHNGEIFYYLRETAKGTGAVFILYNNVKLTTTYDRAVFFFDPAGVLQDYAVSKPSQRGE